MTTKATSRFDEVAPESSPKADQGGGTGSPPVIPRLPIAGYFNELPSSRNDRLMLATELASDPTEVVQLLTESRSTFQSYENSEAFHGGRPNREPDRFGIGKTLDLALRLAEIRRLPVLDAPDLEVEYVDREIVAARTTGGAVHDDGTGPRHEMRFDLLLANADDRTPVVGEVKIGADKDPFWALIQVLACAVQLSTRAQQERLRAQYPAHHFAEGLVPLDVYILLVDYARGTYMPELLEVTERVARSLMRCADVRAFVRRIACLELVSGDTPMAARVVFRAE